MRCTILIVLAVCLTSAYGELVSALSEAQECANESGVDIEKLKEMDRTKSYVIDRKVGCYIACILKKDDAMADDGSLRARSRKFRHDMESSKCAKETTGDDPCDTAAKLMECVLKEQEKLEKEAEKKD